MQKAVIATLDKGFLETTTADADRFVYSNYVMPLLVTAADDVTPLLPGYKRALLNAFAYNGVIDGAEIKKALPALDLNELVAINGLAFDSPPRPPDAGDDDEPHERRDRSTRSALDDATALLNMVGSPESAGDEVLAEAARAKLDQVRASLDNSEFRAYLPPSRPQPTVDEMIQFLVGVVQSDIAYFFLDRTRIRPKGFRLGEHVYALSIAGGEEVTLEQKSFTKRQATFEEQSEQEAEFNLELASTLSTELQEGFERQKSLTDTWSFNAGKTGSYSSPVISDVAYGSFNTNHTFGYSTNVTNADQETRRRSVKDSQTSSAKVAAKYRTAHKITFRVSEERGFETTTRRVIRNPNAFTPVALHYFKILQLVEMHHERYGLRLGWMPSVKDPAAGFFRQILSGKAKILSDAELALPKKPEFQKAAGGQTDDSTLLEKWFPSAITDVGTGDGAGSIRTEVDVDVGFDDGWEWDGSVPGIDITKLGPRPTQNYDVYVVGLPMVVASGSASGSALRVVIHVGAPAENQLPHRRMRFQINVRFTKLVQNNPPPNTGESQDAAYAVALREWEAKVDELRGQAQKAAADWEALMLRNLNPVAEMVGQLMKSLFPPNVRDEAWEIDLWQKVFELERASYIPYPGWWSDAQLRDPTRDPSEFINASWARLYLPVRVGMERLALRWIHGRTTRALDPAIEARFDAIEKDLKKYRKDKFGDETEIMDPQGDGAFREKYETIATWSDLMPTDGTHLEVVQASTMAADEMTLAGAEAASELRQALIDSQKQDARLKAKAHDQITQPASLEVKITPSGAPDE